MSKRNLKKNQPLSPLGGLRPELWREGQGATEILVCERQQGPVVRAPALVLNCRAGSLALP